GGVAVLPAELPAAGGVVLPAELPAEGLSDEEVCPLVEPLPAEALPPCWPWLCFCLACCFTRSASMLSTSLSPVPRLSALGWISAGPLATTTFRRMFFTCPLFRPPKTPSSWPTSWRLLPWISSPFSALGRTSSLPCAPSDSPGEAGGGPPLRALACW